LVRSDVSQAQNTKAKEVMSVIWQFRGINRFLSNFYPVSLWYEGLWYPTAENAYQAAKTLSPKLRKHFSHLDPGEAKKMGRVIESRPFWEDTKLQIMEQIITLKFQDEGMADLLTDTYPSKLVEGNTWGDAYWGMIYKRADENSAAGWYGDNHLGKILMRVRKSLL
jgi:ribA/ribD-fused uncharacterized protein